MIAVFYVPGYQYVSSIHPLLFKQLLKISPSWLRIIDINKFTTKNIHEIIEQADLIIYDHSIIEAIRISIQGGKQSRIFLYFPTLQKSDFYKTVTESILNCNKKKIYWASMNDAHGLQKNIDELELVGLNRNMFLDKMEGIIWFFNSDNLKKDTPLPSSYISGYETIVSNVFQTADFVSKHFEYEFELPHCVSINKEYKEYKKKWDFYIPGISYPTRKIASSSTNGFKLKEPNTKPAFFLKNKINGLYKQVSALNPATAYKINQGIMFYFTKHSKFSFVCGGPTKYFVRKFSEVPLCASVLVGFGPDNLSDYGFIDGINCLFSIPENFGEIVSTYLKDEDYQNKLTKAAYKTILELHSVEKRAEQLINSFKGIKKGHIKKGKFIDGGYRYLDEKGAITSV